MTLNDQFGHISKEYDQFRPKYTDEMFLDLFSYLDQHDIQNDSYLDIGCGTGQLTLKIGSNNFEKVYGADLSENQINELKMKLETKLDDYQESKEIQDDVDQVSNSDFKFIQTDCSNFQELKAALKIDKPFNLISFGQALHWFDVGPYLKDVQKILLDNGLGVVCIFGYTAFDFDQQDGKAEMLIRPCYKAYMAKIMKYYKCNRAILEQKYASFNFDDLFQNVERKFYNQKLENYTMGQFLSYISTTSALIQYQKEFGARADVQLKTELFKLFSQNQLCESEEGFLAYKIQPIIPYYSILMRTK